ncbi:MAG TPA: DUF3604 domain-containing protein [Bacteroidota bacterium]
MATHSPFLYILLMISVIRYLVVPSLMTGLCFAIALSSDQSEPPPQDLVLSEELRLPGYAGAELGRLEYPAIAIDRTANTLHVVYDYTDSSSREGIYLNSFALGTLHSERALDSVRGQYLRITQNPAWNTVTQVSSVVGEEYAPSIAVSSTGTVWIAWSARRKGQWDVYARTFAQDALGEELRLTNNDSNDFRPQVFIDSRDRVWVVWERGTKEKDVTIVAKFFENGSWSGELVIDDRQGYSYRPVVAESGRNTVWFAWDRTEPSGNTDVFIRSFSNGKLQPIVRATHHPAVDNKPALSWFDGKLWVAWTTNRRDQDSWGIIRYPMVRAFDGKAWHEPLDRMPGVDLESTAETQSFEFPTLTFDTYGRMYLFTRHDHAFSICFYEGSGWSRNWNLDDPSWGLRGLNVPFAWASDTELWMARRDRKSITLQKMERIAPRRQKIRLRRVGRTSFPETLKGIEPIGNRGPTKTGGYRVYYGDVHVHTAYSDGSGSFDDALHLYKYVYRRDFLAITDHDALRAGDNHFSPGEWAYLKALNELYNNPGTFVTINGYEWTHSTWSGRQDSANRVGHKNVYFRGGEESPYFSHKSAQASTPELLFKVLRESDAIAFPHHPPWGGMTWHDHDPEIQTNYEIISIHGANEFPGNLPIPHRGGMPGTFAQGGLNNGAVIGFVGGSDSHGLYHHAGEGWREDPYKGGLTAVLLDSPLTRENVWGALKERRNYATSGEPYYLEFSINGSVMGNSITVSEPPMIAFEAKSEKILYATIVRNGKERFISGPVDIRGARYTGIIDDTIESGGNYYYLRVVYKDGTIAWSSPIWVHKR